MLLAYSRRDISHPKHWPLPRGSTAVRSSRLNIVVRSHPPACRGSPGAPGLQQAGHQPP